MAEAADASRDGSRHGADDELSAYRHDSASADQAARLVDSAYVAASRSWDVSSELRAQAVAAGSDPDAPPARELIFAVSYRLRLEPGGKPGVTWCQARIRTTMRGRLASRKLRRMSIASPARLTAASAAATHDRAAGNSRNSEV
jgi:hypothetical protein